MPVLAPSPGRQTTELPTTWNPLVRQEREADTLYLMDLAVEATKVAGVDGLATIAQAFSTATVDKAPWEGGTKLAVVPGRFRDGIKCLNASGGYLYMPLAGLLPPNEFTVEMQVRTDAAWADLPAAAGTTAFGVRMAPSNEMSLYFVGSTLTLNYRHTHGSATLVKTINFTDATVPAATWKSLAFTLLAGTLRLYVEGVLVGTATGCTSPALWSSIEATEGLSVCGHGEAGALNVTVSDLRISRRARVPSATVAAVRGRNIVTVDTATVTGTVNQRLRGTLHDRITGEYGLVHVVRSDKFLTACPIKAGAPDANHPTAGQSGLYSYNWKPVDNWLADMTADGVSEVYISLDSCPQLLGGGVAPLSGSALETGRGYSSPYAREVPNDSAAFAKMCVDLIHHVTVTKGFSAPYWGLWNEPHANGDFWAGTEAQFQSLYAAVAPAVKAFNPALKIGGPEGSSDAWVTNLIAYCQTNAVALDFVSWHPYEGFATQAALFDAHVARAKTAAGRTAPLEILNGEWSAVSNSGFFATGRRPWSLYQYGINDWAAASMAANFIEHQRLGITHAINATARAVNPAATAHLVYSYQVTALFGPTQAYATGNVFRLWRRMEPAVVSSTVAADPSISAVASKNATTGKITVLVARTRYRKDAGVPVEVVLPGLANGRAVTVTMIDDSRSNGYENGNVGDLETVAPLSGPTTFNGRVQVSMKARSVCLIEIAP